MRAFSIIALCFLAAGASALEIGPLSDCLQNELKERINSIVLEVNDRLEKVSGEGGDAVSKAREHFEEKSDAFRNALSEPLNQARADYEECLKTSNRIVCTISMGRDLVTKVIPIASEKTIDLVQAVNEIVGEFRNNRQAGMDDLRQKGSEFGRSMISALRTCFTQ